MCVGFISKVTFSVTKILADVSLHNMLILKGFRKKAYIQDKAGEGLK